MQDKYNGAPLDRTPGVNDLLRLRKNMMAGHYSLMTGLMM
jgi:hypothetical protein